MKKNISHKSATSNQEIIDSCDFLSNAASTQDCTGLIPSGPMNEDELESYEAVYHYQPPDFPTKVQKICMTANEHLSPKERSTIRQLPANCASVQTNSLLNALHFRGCQILTSVVL